MKILENPNPLPSNIHICEKCGCKFEYTEIDKPNTIKFKPDIDAMVEDYKKRINYYHLVKWAINLSFDSQIDSYRQGLKDMYKKLKGE